MTPVIPCSTSGISLIPGTAFAIKKHNHVAKGSLSRKSIRHTLSSQRLVLPLLSSVTLLPQYRSNYDLLHRSLVHHIVSATGTDVAVEEPDSPVVDEDSGGGGATLTSADAGETVEKSTVKPEANPAPSQSRRSRPSRKSEMPPVKDEDLVPGATFTGKVRSVVPFGAFVDFGAFTDGLVHVSKLSDSFVKDIGDVVSVGQEVKVRLLEVDTNTGRISLSMRENDDTNDSQQRKDSTAAAISDKPRPTRKKPIQKRDEVKSSIFVEGQDLEGIVKNLTRSGAFVSLPEGEEGFLPAAEEADDGPETLMGGSSLQVGQEVSVRVLRINRGKVTLTMKKDDDDDNLEMEVGHGVIHVGSNPFVLAFRKNKDIAAFLDEREKVLKAAKEPVTPKTYVEIESTIDISDPAAVPEQLATSDVVPASVPSIVDEPEDEETSKELAVGATIDSDIKEIESVESASPSMDSSVRTVEKEAEESSEILDPEGTVSIAEKITQESLSVDGKTDSSGSIASEALSQESPIDEKLVESKAGNAIVEDKAQTQTGSAENETSASPTDCEGVGTIHEENGIQGSAETVEISDPSGVSGETQAFSSESQAVEEVVDTQARSTQDEVQIQAPAADTEVPSDSEVEDDKLEPTSEENASVGNPNAQNGNSSPKETASEATISPALVKQLREETGAGMMDCKKALSEAGGDIIKAQEFLRKKGLASAEKKASRATAEGRIGSYIHDSRIGVLIEVNCETDFVSRGDIFKELVDDLAMQVAACPQVQYLVAEDVSEEIVNKEREIEMQKEDLLSKPEQIRSKIVEGRIRKRLEELALLEQPYIKNDKVTVKDWVKQTIATVGENIKVKRFIRYNLGEGLEKKSQDFAAEVAAQTAAKPVAAPAKEEPAEAEAKETTSKPPAVAVSAALVKQLREETGAGMMDCKKALSETGGDLEKAQEYLRKKGLSTADKKSGRLAAEGRIGSYIHDARIGVLIEVNSETDFVGRSEKFKELVDDLAMQVVACPQVRFVSIEEIPESTVNKEKELEMQREDLKSKPESIREKIVEGRVSKRLGELALLEHPYIKDDSVLVKDLVKQTVAALGENIKVRRFVRFTLGEETNDA